MKPRTIAIGLWAVQVFVLGFAIPNVLGQQTLLRTWTDKSGRFAVAARLTEVLDGAAKLTTRAGREIEVELSRLCKPDIRFVEGVSILEDSHQQFRLLQPHLGKVTERPSSVLEILGQLHGEREHGVAAGLYAGCLHASIGGKSGLAPAKRFTSQTVKRLKTLREAFPELQVQTLISGLNNEALLALRERKANNAARMLVQAGELTENLPFVVYHNASILLEVSSLPRSQLKLDARPRGDLVSLLTTKQCLEMNSRVPKRFMYSLTHNDFPSVPMDAASVRSSPVDRVQELVPVAPNYQLASFGTGFLVSPTLVMTNRHVIEGHEDGNRFRIRSENALQGTRFASVLKVSEDPDVDLALLELESSIGTRPLALRRSPVKLGESFLVLGYPNPNLFEATLTASTGHVNKLLKQGTSIMHDAGTNQGNSGGPCLDDCGNVTGVLYAFYTQEASKGNQRNLAVSAPAALDFLRGVQGFESEGLSNDARELTTVIEAAKDAVFQIECWAPDEPLSTRTSSKKLGEQKLRKISLWPELTCFSCGGGGRHDCPKCVNGWVSVKRRVQVGFNRVNKTPIFGVKVFKQKCDECGGAAGWHCPHCRGGRLSLH